MSTPLQLSLQEIEPWIRKWEASKPLIQPIVTSKELQEYREQFNMARGFEDDEEWLPVADKKPQDDADKETTDAAKEKGVRAAKKAALNAAAQKWSQDDTRSQASSNYHSATSDAGASDAQYTHASTSSPEKKTAYAQTGGYYHGPARSPESKSAYTYPKNGGFLPTPGFYSWNGYSGYH